MGRGYFVPEAVFTVTASATPSLTKTVTFTGEAVALRDGLLSADIAGSRNRKRFFDFAGSAGRRLRLDIRD